jgi:hypothetical protein
MFIELQSASEGSPQIINTDFISRVTTVGDGTRCHLELAYTPWVRDADGDMQPGEQELTVLVDYESLREALRTAGPFLSLLPKPS